ncbi:ANK-REP-REGION domain-containing protein [Mycena sanguinolenta]|uniref:ANK-REP-REGION domain-containing protein n=1 Tax=Mycena sanguinolenta TaxID=230812 RepID=A0A8H6YMA8_9AGAR|nr:ANK-REP-REGION domain-containing protein [Mycena sanguinolenta]
MSFGVGLGDIALVTTWTWSIYKSCKESSEDFRKMTGELMGLHAVLCEMKDFMEENGDQLEDSRRNRLTILMDGCKSSLQELYDLYTRYESLSTQRQRTWDRMRFGLKNLADVRQRIITSTTALNTFTTALLSASIPRLEKRLVKLVTEVQSGMREKSVVSVSDIAATIDSPQVWGDLRRELDDVGISPVVAEERREFIISWLKDAAAAGMLDENARLVGVESASIRTFTPVDDEDLDSASILPDDESFSIRSITPTPGDDRESNFYHTAMSHDHGSSEGTTAGARSAALNMNAMSNAFDAEVKRRHNDRPVAEIFDPLAASITYALPSPSSTSVSSNGTARPTPRRRRTFGLVEKLFQKQTAIVQAASDGDIDKVARLLSMGMDVNAVDRWGWSALSMCGYGGHVAIARLLLDHGAKIDNVDVDGDTPKSLAEQRGHSDVAIMLEEEEALRELRQKEALQSIESMHMARSRTTSSA